MALPSSLCEIVVDDPIPTAVQRPQPIVVMLRGEHDLSTAALVSEAFDTTIALSQGDVVMDLSEVTFFSASTVGLVAHLRATDARPRPYVKPS